jgi:hypothetical protein
LPAGDQNRERPSGQKFDLGQNARAPLPLEFHVAPSASLTRPCPLRSRPGTVLIDAIWGKLLCGLAEDFATGRLFIIGHDACHQSLTPHSRLNKWLGRIAFLPPLTPYNLGTFFIVKQPFSEINTCADSY